MPVRNGGAYLQGAVDSILAQTHENLELVIIDDHSTDQAIDNLRTDQRVKIYSSRDPGIVPALNLGIENAQHPYIARMDGDDIADPQRLEIQLAFLIEFPQIQIAGAKVELFRDDQAIGGGYAHYQEWINQQCTSDEIERNFFVESCIPHPTALMHRDVLDKLSGYIDTPWPEDYDLWCRAHLAGYKFGKPKTRPLLKWRDHNYRESRSNQRYSKQQFLRCKAKYLSQWLKQRGERECVIWGAGPTGLKLHDYLQNNGLTVKGFVDINPKLIGRRKRQKPIHIINPIPTQSDSDALTPFTIIAVSARGARHEIRNACVNTGLRELRNFIFAA